MRENAYAMAYEAYDIWPIYMRPMSYAINLDIFNMLYYTYVNKGS